MIIVGGIRLNYFPYQLEEKVKANCRCNHNSKTRFCPNCGTRNQLIYYHPNQYSFGLEWNVANKDAIKDVASYSKCYMLNEKVAISVDITNGNLFVVVGIPLFLGCGECNAECDVMMDEEEVASQLETVLSPILTKDKPIKIYQCAEIFKRIYKE